MIGVGIFMVCRTTTMINPWIVATVCTVLSVPIAWLFSQRFRGIINFNVKVELPPTVKFYHCVAVIAIDVIRKQDTRIYK